MAAGRWCGLVFLATAVMGAPPELNMGLPHHIAVTSAGAGPATPPSRAAGRLVTATFWSQALGARKQLIVWLPPSYDTAPARRYPVAIYLHGLWGSESDWSQRAAIARALESLAATHRELIVVMPDGDDSWYTTWNWLGDWPGCRRDFTPRDGSSDTADTYCVPWPHYDDYIARDLVAFVDRTWRTDARRDRRAIAGLSMGGYGALALAFAYPDVFSVAASHSGVVSPMYVGPKPFAAPPLYAATAAELAAGWGERLWPTISQAFGRDTAAWWSRDPARRARTLWSRDRTRMPAIYLDIGTEDGLLAQNRAFRHELQALKIPHAYHEHPGAHDWAYWSRHVPASLQFIAERIAR